MTSREEVKQFLAEFRQLAKIFGIVFIEREKNIRALLELGITAKIREEIILGLQVKNFYRGPAQDKTRPQFEIWEFGVQWTQYEQIYIKLSTRTVDNSPVCISFHKAEFKINYPFKKE